MQDTYGNQLIPFNDLTADDVVIIPAFGTTLQIQQTLSAKNIQTEKYNTTCPFVRKVWNRSEQIAEKGYSVVVHGKPKHEETRATFSHASANTPTVIVNDMKETMELAKYITGEKPEAAFYEEFEGPIFGWFQCCERPTAHWRSKPNDQLASDTQAISDYLKQCDDYAL